MDYRALLIDLDGVIRHWPPDSGKSSGTPPGAVLEIAFEPKLLTQAITGKISDEVWRDFTLREIARRFPRADLNAIKKSWDEKSGFIDEEVLSLMKTVAKTRRVTLVTNATTRLDSDLKQSGLSETFYAIVNSSKIGIAKPDTGIFTAALNLSGVGAHQALFVDDSPKNVQAATSCGIRSHHFVGCKELTAFLQTCEIF